MRIFISYKFTKVPTIALHQTVGVLVKALRDAGYEVFCNLERDDEYIQKKWSTKEIMTECLEELDKCDYHITFVAPNTTLGEGMLLELGYAKKMNIPTLLLIPPYCGSISTRAVVDKFFIYKNMGHLLSRILSLINN
jgi:nucleoside 2-deoxyribosyltransferase